MPRNLITLLLTVAFVVFRTDEGRCRWVDLLWDHRHPGALELVNHLSSTSNGRPTGQRGLFAYSRLGAGFTTGAAATLPGSLLNVT